MCEEELLSTHRLAASTLWSARLGTEAAVDIKSHVISLRFLTSRGNFIEPQRSGRASELRYGKEDIGRSSILGSDLPGRDLYTPATKVVLLRFDHMRKPPYYSAAYLSVSNDILFSSSRHGSGPGPSNLMPLTSITSPPFLR